MSSITVGVEVIGFDEGNEVDGWGDGFAVGLDDVGGDDGVEVGVNVGNDDLVQMGFDVVS
ncbi:MAG: hypothetical protein JZU67_08800 [Burkholderiaceae bacterium]|nr:hypothetical protein [Burkholderiaceae bacterium]